MSGNDEEHIASQLRRLPRPPEAWIEAAAELPVIRRSLDDLVQRARADVVERRRVLSDLEAALRQEGVEPTPGAVAALRARIAGPVA